MIGVNFEELELWMVTGSQHLYGSEALDQVRSHGEQVAAGLNAKSPPIKIVYKGVLTSRQSITAEITAVNSSNRCVGLIAWMHTFSPAKMWISGLQQLCKPLLHLHTQMNARIPESIDMDYMNLHQSAHGGREFGHLLTRLGIYRKTVVGHWKGESTLEQIAAWGRVCAAVADSRQMRVVRFGDNMRNVAVTEGNKVLAESVFGYAVDGFGLGDLVEHVEAGRDSDISRLIREYEDRYEMDPDLCSDGAYQYALRSAAKIELGLRSFLLEEGFTAFTTTFEDLHGLEQLPGLAVQRLMADGYGFAAEGDWKTAALVRSIKVMGKGLAGGSSFMEDYTYDFIDGLVLGAHMLEICPSISTAIPRCEVHPLGIGGKSNPVRLVFRADSGPALNASVVELGSSYRLVVNPVHCPEYETNFPQLPVAHAIWQPKPNLVTAAQQWLHAGGSHHTCFTQNISVDMLRTFAEIMGIEMVLIG